MAARCEPSSPPVNATMRNGRRGPMAKVPPVTRPKILAIEFTRINADEVVAVHLGSAQHIMRINGLRKMPPPTPASPETKPIRAVVDMKLGGTAEKDRTARYPDTPPCPTDEQRNATPKKRSEITATAGKENCIMILREVHNFQEGRVPGSSVPLTR
jgi:hypothetical protein